MDEPTVEAIQTLMLLSQANFQSGRGKKTFMLLCKFPYFETALFADYDLSFCYQYGLCA